MECHNVHDNTATELLEKLIEQVKQMAKTLEKIEKALSK